MILVTEIGQDGYVFDTVLELHAEARTGSATYSDQEVAFHLAVRVFCQASFDLVKQMGNGEVVVDEPDLTHPEGDAEGNWEIIVWRGYDIADAVRAYQYYGLRLHEVL